MSADEALTLSDQQLERLADLLVIKLARVKPAASPLLTVEDVCATFQVSRAWVYENAGRLGGVKLGPGRRAPLRFDAKQVAAALNPLTSSETVATPIPSTRPGRKRPKHLHPVYDG
jgi:hypothetical protein